jgi:pimeloyl-ACP methyl ester carboxylesterase
VHPVRWAALLFFGVPIALAVVGIIAMIAQSGEFSRSCFRILRFVLLSELLLAVMLGIWGAIYQARSNARDQNLHPPPGKLIDVGGGYRLHLYCTGESGPTVVLDYGLSGSYLDWYFVQPEVARSTRVCSWDRSGYGWSDRSAKPQVPSVIAEELHNLLERAGEKPPFVLVGHSLGAFDVRMYAHLYPEQVAGIVLVDGAIPDEDIPFTWRSRWQLKLLQYTAPFGLPRWRSWCTGGPEAIRPMKRAFSCSSRVFRAHYEQWSVFPQSAAEVRKLRSMGDLPLVVISRDPRRSAKTDGSVLAYEQHWEQQQQELLRLSSRATYIIAAGSGHSVPLDRPDVVIEAIRKIIAQANTKDNGLTTKDTKRH